MLWELSVAEQRYRAVLEVGIGVPVAEVAERYGVSRQTVHTWLLRYRQEGITGLEDRSHQVHNHPWRIPAEVEELICELRRGHPKWGPRRLVFEMGRRGHQVTRSSVYRTLVRNGLVEPKSRRRRRKDYRRWERAAAMELWQLDVTASAFLTDGTEVKTVTGMDDHSRFCVIATAVRRATARPVCLAFVDAMRVYGVPDEVLTDNGKVFTGRFHKPGVPVEVLFDRICWDNGVTRRLTKIHSPTTTGKIERLHQTLQRELLDVHGPFESIEELQAALDAWRQEYNTTRPHRWRWASTPAGSRLRTRRWNCASPPSLWRAPATCSRRALPKARRLNRFRSRRQHRSRSPPQAMASLPWRWTGWCPHRGTCGSAGSRFGSAPRWPGGLSPSGLIRPVCMCCWMVPGSRPCRPGLDRRVGPASRQRGASGWAVPAAHGRGDRGGPHGQRLRRGRPGRGSSQRRLPTGWAAGHPAHGRTADGRHRLRGDAAAHHDLPSSGAQPIPAARRPPGRAHPSGPGQSYHGAASGVVPGRAHGRPPENPGWDDSCGQDRHGDLREQPLPAGHRRRDHRRGAPHHHQRGPPLQSQ